MKKEIPVAAIVAAVVAVIALVVVMGMHTLSSDNPKPSPPKPGTITMDAQPETYGRQKIGRGSEQ